MVKLDLNFPISILKKTQFDFVVLAVAVFLLRMNQCRQDVSKSFEERVEKL